MKVVISRKGFHPELAKALKAVRPRRGKTILTGDRGKPLNPIYLGSVMAKAIEKAGLPEACVLHGLRKTAARTVAETGGSLSSVTGHLSDQMARHYSRRADQKGNAKSAILKWAKADKNKKGKLQTGE